MLRRARSVNSNRTINPLFGAIGPLGGTELFDLVCRRNDFSVSRREIAVTKKTIENFFIKEVLPKIYLAKSDRMSMSNGLELRSPLLDYLLSTLNNINIHATSVSHTCLIKR